MDGEGLNKDSFGAVNESKEHNIAAPLTCLKKVIEKAEKINAAKYDKTIVWSDGCSALFRSRFVLRLLKVDFFDSVELTWNYNEKSHGEGRMDSVGKTLKNIIFRRVKSGFVTIDSLFEFHQVILKFVPSIKSVYLPHSDVLNEAEDIEQESKKILESLKIHHVERFEVKWGIWLKVFLPGRGLGSILWPMVFKWQRFCHLRARNRKC